MCLFKYGNKHKKKEIDLFYSFHKINLSLSKNEFQIDKQFFFSCSNLQIVNYEILMEIFELIRVHCVSM